MNIQSLAPSHRGDESEDPGFSGRSGACTGALLALLVSVMLLGSGCAGHREVVPESERESKGADSVASMPPPTWQTERFQPQTPGKPGGTRVLFDDPGADLVVFSQDTALLRAEVASECLASRRISRRDALGDIVLGLYLSDIDPGEATEALIRGQCAETLDIVREMVAIGGEVGWEAVLGRADALEPGRSRAALENAAAQGLARFAAARGVEVVPIRGARRLAMAYFPSMTKGTRVELSSGRDELLYREALSGYAVYTFVLAGAGLEGLAEQDLVRHRELLRLIETYTGIGDDSAGGARSAAHVFLVPVDPTLGRAPLFSQVAPDLSDMMRRALITDLRWRDEQRLAKRLERASGPFLVSSLTPALAADGANRHLLVVDLSEVGAEHLFAVVDALDRNIPAGLVATGESLRWIQERLITGVPSPGQPPSSGDHASGWVFMLEG